MTSKKRPIARAKAERDGNNDALPRVFISHAMHDKPLVKEFVELLERGVGAPMKSIFCTAFEEQGIRPGAHFVESIKENLKGSALVIALISEAYYASPFCMCELGGVWATNKEFLPIIVPPLDYDDLVAVLKGLHVRKVFEASHLDGIRDHLRDGLGLDLHPTSRWSETRDKFLKKQKQLLKHVSYNGSVSRENFEEAEAERSACKQRIAELEKELATRDATIVKLKKAKDHKAVEKVMRERARPNAEFETVVSAARAALSPLSGWTKKALFAGSLSPTRRDDMHEIEAVVTDGELDFHEDDGVFRPDANHPQVAKAVRSIKALKAFLASADDRFIREYRDANGGFAPDVTKSHFWARHYLSPK